MKALFRVSDYRIFTAQSLIFAIVCSMLYGTALGQKMERQPAFAIPKTADAGDSKSTIETGCSPTKINTIGNSGTTGTYGNIRTFSSGGISVKASAFSRRKTDGAWETAFLGAFSPGLGVTDRGEDGNNGTHRVDNVGDRQNYVLFEFNQAVVLDQVYLASVVTDSDLTVWVGNTNDPYNNHLTLSDSLLNSFGPGEDNNTGSATDRWADINGGQIAGNVFVVAASVTDTTPEDWFKVGTLDVNCAPPSAKVTIIKEVFGLGGTTGSTSSFTFNATGLGTNSFSLVDNDVVGPDRYINPSIQNFGASHPITVTEAQTASWSLSDLACTESGGISNTTTDLSTQTATIIAEAGESIVCTFSNVQLRPSAAPTTISGRAIGVNSRGINGAFLSLTDIQTGEIKTVRTNQFGYYAIRDVEVGRVYVLSIRYKKYTFIQDTRVIDLTDQVSNEDFVQTY